MVWVWRQGRPYWSKASIVTGTVFTLFFLEEYFLNMFSCQLIFWFDMVLYLLEGTVNFLNIMLLRIILQIPFFVMNTVNMFILRSAFWVVDTIMFTDVSGRLSRRLASFHTFYDNMKKLVGGNKKFVHGLNTFLTVAVTRRVLTPADSIDRHSPSADTADILFTGVLEIYSKVNGAPRDLPGRTATFFLEEARTVLVVCYPVYEFLYANVWPFIRVSGVVTTCVILVSQLLTNDELTYTMNWFIYYRWKLSCLCRSVTRSTRRQFTKHGCLYRKTRSIMVRAIIFWALLIDKIVRTFQATCWFVIGLLWYIKDLLWYLKDLVCLTKEFIRLNKHHVLFCLLWFCQTSLRFLRECPWWWYIYQKRIIIFLLKAMIYLLDSVALNNLRRAFGTTTKPRRFGNFISKIENVMRFLELQEYIPTSTHVEIEAGHLVITHQTHDVGSQCYAIPHRSHVFVKQGRAQPSKKALRKRKKVMAMKRLSMFRPIKKVRNVRRRLKGRTTKPTYVPTSETSATLRAFVNPKFKFTPMRERTSKKATFQSLFASAIADRPNMGEGCRGTLHNYVEYNSNCLVSSREESDDGNWLLDAICEPDPPLLEELPDPKPRLVDYLRGKLDPAWLVDDAKFKIKEMTLIDQMIWTSLTTVSLITIKKALGW